MEKLKVIFCTLFVCVLVGPVALISQSATSPVVRTPWNSVFTTFGLVCTGTPCPVFNAAQTGGVDGLLYCTTPTSPDQSCVTNAFTANVSSVVTMRVPFAVNAEMDVPATGKLIIQGNVTMGANGLIVALQNTAADTAGGTIECLGDNPTQVTISVPQTFALSNQAVIVAESGSRVSGCQIAFSQPEQSVRNTMIHYPPAILTSLGVRLEHLLLEECWNCITLNGGGGGAQTDIVDVRMSAYNRAIAIDNTLDSVKIDRVHIWPFSFSADSTKMAAYLSAGNIGIESGRCDDLKISNTLFYVPQAMSFFQGTGVQPGPTFGEISNIDCDTFGCISMSAGNLTASSVQSTIGVAGYTSFQITGGSLSMSGWRGYGGIGAALIDMTGGDMQVSSGHVDIITSLSNYPIYMHAAASDLARLTLTGIHFLSPIDQTIVQNTGGYTQMVGNSIIKTPGTTAWAQPLIHFTTNQARGHVSNWESYDLGVGGSLTFVKADVDTWVFVNDNMLLGSTLNPSTSGAFFKVNNNF